MKMQAEFEKTEAAQQVKLRKEHIRRWSKLTSQLYEEALMLTKEEQERLIQGLIRYAVVSECIGLFGREKAFFLRMMELREQYRLETEEGVPDPEASEDRTVPLPAGSLQKSSEDDHDHDHDTILYNNNILYSKRNIKISTIESSQHQDHDHDHDNIERESVVLRDIKDPYDNKDATKANKGEQSSTNRRDVALCEEDPVTTHGDTRWVDDLIQEDRDCAAAAERVIEAVEQLCHMRCYDYVRDEITCYTGRMGEALCLLAVERAKRYGGTTWGYIRRIMADWCTVGIHTPEEATEYCRQFDEGRRRVKRCAFSLPQS